MRNERVIPLGEVLAIIKPGPMVRQRIERKYAALGGVPEGERLQGWNRNHQFSREFLCLRLVGPKQFIADFGRAAYRSIPKDKLVRQGHRKAIPYEVVRAIQIQRNSA